MKYILILLLLTLSAGASEIQDYEGADEVWFVKFAGKTPKGVTTHPYGIFDEARKFKPKSVTIKAKLDANEIKKAKDVLENLGAMWPSDLNPAAFNAGYIFYKKGVAIDFFLFNTKTPLIASANIFGQLTKKDLEKVLDLSDSITTKRKNKSDKGTPPDFVMPEYKPFTTEGTEVWLTTSSEVAHLKRYKIVKFTDKELQTVKKILANHEMYGGGNGNVTSPNYSMLTFYKNKKNIGHVILYFDSKALSLNDKDNDYTTRSLENKEGEKLSDYILSLSTKHKDDKIKVPAYVYGRLKRKVKK